MAGRQTDLQEDARFRILRLLEENPEITELINNKEQVMNFILSNPGELPFDLEMRSPIDICLAQQNVELAKLDNYIC